ncbi:5'-nucleotidase C-terminal domain-containing protein [Thiocapsa sp. UBA6158]|uniref:5'-nucleotidase C-terminal domain-containing protein n=1 Tax=Thiocapsa sp. UBA6158 TaxID=1947692 RepID=UPI0025CD84DD|nr:5'-nucleotidase C-terminal domain-containing protein [Thiocapsa sp. UBA6158]
MAVGAADEIICERRVPTQPRAPCNGDAVSLSGAQPSINGGFSQQVVTDAFLARAFRADIALQSGGGVRITIPEGDITIGTAYTLLPFSNTKDADRAKHRPDRTSRGTPDALLSCPARPDAGLRGAGLHASFWAPSLASDLIKINGAGASFPAPSIRAGSGTISWRTRTFRSTISRSAPGRASTASSKDGSILRDPINP